LLFGQLGFCRFDILREQMGREDFVSELLQPLTDRPTRQNPTAFATDGARKIDTHVFLSEAAR
jgi:hypothetical protein